MRVLWCWSAVRSLTDLPYSARQIDEAVFAQQILDRNVERKPRP